MWLYIAGSLILAWASLVTGQALGRFRPVPLILGLFLAYNALPFVVISLSPALASAMLLGTYSYYTVTTMEFIGRLVFACTLAAYGGQFLATVIYDLKRRQLGLLVSTSFDSEPTVPVDTVLIAATFLLLLVSALGIVSQMRAMLFAGYFEGFGVDQGELILRGTLSSVFSLLFINYLFLWNVGCERWRRRRLRRVEYFFTSAGVLVIGVLLMSLGGRLYAASAVITVIALRLAFGKTAPEELTSPKKTSHLRTLLVAIGLLGAASLVGIWRSQGDFSFEAALGNALSEPLFVSISLTSLVSSNVLPAIAFPHFLLGDWVGVLPSSIYPQKMERFFAVFQTYSMESPVGGLSGLATLIINFGWLGTIILFAVMGFGLTWLSATVQIGDRTGARRLFFVIATTFPVFSLWRDPPVIAVYKNLLQNTLFWPWLLSMLLIIRSTAPFRRQQTSLEV